MSMDAFDGTGGDSGALHDTYVVSIKGQSFAIGVFWNNFENRQTAVKEAREMAAKPNVDGDLFCVRASGSQYGIGRKDNGHANNMVALAGALADQRGGNWIGLFQVENGYYLLAVRDDDILAETDRFILDELEARGQFDELLLNSDWHAVFAPEGFDVDNATTTPLEDMVRKAKGPRLQPTDKVGGMLRLAIGGGVILALIVGGMWYFQTQGEAALQKQLEDMKNQFNQSVSPEEVVEVPPAPWEGKPTGVSYLHACIGAMNRATMSIPGWNTDGIACDGNSVHMILNRAGDLGEEGGPISWIRWGLDQVGLQEAVASPISDNQVEVVWDFVPDQINQPGLGTAKISTARRYLQSALEDTFTPTSFPENPKTDEFFSTLRFEFVTPFDPNEFESILKEIPGLTIERVVLDLTDFVYKVEGSVHEQIYFPETANAQLN